MSNIRDADFVDMVEERAIKLVSQWQNDFEDREGALPKNQVRPSPGELLALIMMKYPPELLEMDTPEGVVQFVDSPFLLWLRLDDRIQNRDEVLRLVERGLKRGNR